MLANIINWRKNNSQLLKLATYASVLTAAILITVKLIAWLLTGSISILASLIDSLMDSAASTVNLLAVRYSLTPADGDHRFGHGKAEPLAGLVQAGFICGSALFLVFHALERLRFPQPLRELNIGISVMAFSIVLTAFLLLFQYHVIKRTQSTAIRADALHYGTDLISNAAIIIGLLLSTYGWVWIDAVLAIGIAIYIFISAINIGRDALHQLLDKELDDVVKDQIIAISVANPQVHGVHDLRTRQSGQIKFIQLHLELDDDLKLTQAHTIADEVEAAICSFLPGAEVIVHQDPASLIESNTKFRN